MAFRTAGSTAAGLASEYVRSCQHSDRLDDLSRAKSTEPSQGVVQSDQKLVNFSEVDRATTSPRLLNISPPAPTSQFVQ